MSWRNALLLLMLGFQLPANASDAREPRSIPEAWKLFDAGKKAEALAMFRSIVDATPDEPAIHRAYQQAMINAGHYLSLRKEYRERLAGDRKKASSYFHLSMIEEEVELGKKLAEDGLRIDPKSEQLLWLVSFYRTTDLAARGKYAEVVDELDKDGRGNPFYYRMQRAGALAEQRKLDEALVEAEKAVAIEPHDPEAYLQRAWIYYQRNERAKARESLLPALAFGDFAAVHAALGGFLSIDGKAAEAKEQYRAALRAPRDNVGWACAMMDAHQGLGNGVEAERYARLALHNDARNRCARATLIYQALSRGDLGAAEKQARALLELNPRDINGINSLAQVNMQRSRFKEASKLYENGLAINPDDPGLLVGFAVAATHAGRCDEAQAKLKRAKKILPDSPEVDRAFGACAHARGDYQEASRYYARVVEALPKDVWGYEGLGAAQFAAGYPDVGRVSFQKALRYASTPAERKRFEDGRRSWERRTNEEEQKFPREAKSAPVVFTVTERLDLEYPLAYQSGSQFFVGRPWSSEIPLYQSSTSTVRDFVAPAWSPDGKTLYLGDEGISALELATGRVRKILDLPRTELDLTVEEAAQLSDGATSSTSPVQLKLMRYLNNRISRLYVSPDGQALYYQVGTTSGTEMRENIERIGIDGRGRTQILAPQQGLSELLADGTGGGLIVERSNDPPLRLSLETGRTTADAKPDDCTHNRASFAPDGRQSVCDGHTPAGRELRIAGTGGKRRLGLRGSHPAWSPDGKTIAYIHGETELRLLDPISGKTRRVVLPFEKDLDDPQATSSWSRGPIWSPDSRHVLYTLGYMRDRKDKKPIHFLTVIADLEGAKAWYTPMLIDNVAWSPKSVVREGKP